MLRAGGKHGGSGTAHWPHEIRLAHGCVSGTRMGSAGEGRPKGGGRVGHSGALERSRMSKQSWRDRLIDPRSPDRRPRRAAYALPTFFTAGNVFLGFYALMESFQGSMAMISDAASAPHHFQNAALAIGWSVFLDGLDGRIARLTNTVSEFGREMDSLADSISFGLAPAVLAFTWGVQFVDPSIDRRILEYLHSAGYFLA